MGIKFPFMVRVVAMGYIRKTLNIWITRKRIRAGWDIQNIIEIQYYVFQMEITQVENLAYEDSFGSITFLVRFSTIFTGY